MGLLFRVSPLALVLAPLVLAWAQTAPSLDLAERKMVRAGYMETLTAAHWAVEQGEAVVPVLHELLKRRQDYAKKLGGSTGAYPFNVVWALAQISTPSSLQVLLHFYSQTQDATAALGIKAITLRQQKKSREYGVLMNDRPLLAQAGSGSPVIKELTAGQALKIIKPGVVNPKEEGPRGGPAMFDQVEVVPTGEKGFVERAGDGFPSYI